MKNIEIDDELYQYIVKNTEQIGESASSILRRLLGFNTTKETLPVATSLETVDSELNSRDEVSVKKLTRITNKSVEYLFNYINKEDLSMQRSVVGQFLLILAALYRVHPNKFSLVTEIRGKGRLYFGKSADELEASGSSTKPKQIGQSSYWVITNTNTTRKKMILKGVAEELGYDDLSAEKISALLPPAKKKKLNAIQSKALKSNK